ncbi:MAG: hypothetical protein ACK4MM_03390 [Fervidobacterium sp.]
MFKRLVFTISLVLLLSVPILTLASEVGVGVFYSFSGSLYYVIDYNTLGIVKNAPNTTSGFNIMILTNFSEYLLSAGGMAKYDNRLDIGLVSLYGMGGFVVPINDFALEKMTAIIKIGAKYYFNNFSITSGLFNFYKPDNAKVEGIEFSVGYSF